jgi:hypothetical protein
MKTSDKLAAALREAGAPGIMIGRAEHGYYDDYKSHLAMPLHQLVVDARQHKLEDIAKRAIAGEFDGTKEEGDEWAASPEGQAIISELGG